MSRSAGQIALNTLINTQTSSAFIYMK